MANTQALIAEVYSAFNQRNIDGALALMSESVTEPITLPLWTHNFAGKACVSRSFCALGDIRFRRRWTHMCAAR